jgi:hypothetical protein
MKLASFGMKGYPSNERTEDNVVGIKKEFGTSWTSLSFAQ